MLENEYALISNNNAYLFENDILSKKENEVLFERDYPINDDSFPSPSKSKSKR